MSDRRFVVHLNWDEDAGVWYVSDSNVPGLATEAETPQAMLKKLTALIPELVALNEEPDGDEEVPLELLYSCSTSVRTRDSRR